MAKIGENAVVNAIRRGVEEMHAFVTGNAVQEPVHAPPEPAKAEAARAQAPSYEHGLAEAARAPRQVSSRGMER